MHSVTFTAWIGTDGPNPEIEAFIITIIVGGALAASVGVYLLCYLIQRFALKKPGFNWKTLLASIIVGVIIFPGSIYIRDAIDKQVWVELQNRCAKESGYERASDNQDQAVVTWQSQQTYLKCVERGRSR